MEIKFNDLQEELEWQDFLERVAEFMCDNIDETAIELLQEMQNRGLTFE